MNRSIWAGIVLAVLSSGWTPAQEKPSKAKPASALSQEGGLAFVPHAKNFIDHTISDQWIRVSENCQIEVGHTLTKDRTRDAHGLTPVFTYRNEGSLAVLRPELTMYHGKAPIIRLTQRGGGGDSVRTIVESRYDKRIFTGISIDLFVNDRYSASLLEWLTHMSNLCGAPDWR